MSRWPRSMSRTVTEKPHRLDKVYDESRKDIGKQPNGYIRYIDWEQRELIVTFLDDVREHVDYSFDSFEGMFRKAYGGIWHLR